jgi:hypothetical protein
MVMGGPDDPILGWLRRGEADGETYRQMAILRRVRRWGSTGADAGTVLLRGFHEEHEPVVIVGRSTSHPKLVSFVADKTGTVKIVQWNLPPAESRDQASMVRPTAVRAAEVRPAISPSAHDACTNVGHLSRTWLTRPPVGYDTSRLREVGVARLLASRWDRPANTYVWRNRARSWTRCISAR